MTDASWSPARESATWAVTLARDSGSNTGLCAARAAPHSTPRNEPQGAPWGPGQRSPGEPDDLRQHEPRGERHEAHERPPAPEGTRGQRPGARHTRPQPDGLGAAMRAAARMARIARAIRGRGGDTGATATANAAAVARERRSPEDENPGMIPSNARQLDLIPTMGTTPNRQPNENQAKSPASGTRPRCQRGGGRVRVARVTQPCPTVAKCTGRQRAHPKGRAGLARAGGCPPAITFRSELAPSSGEPDPPRWGATPATHVGTLADRERCPCAPRVPHGATRHGPVGGQRGARTTSPRSATVPTWPKISAAKRDLGPRVPRVCHDLGPMSNTRTTSARTVLDCAPTAGRGPRTECPSRPMARHERNLQRPTRGARQRTRRQPGQNLTALAPARTPAQPLGGASFVTLPLPREPSSGRLEPGTAPLHKRRKPRAH